MKFAEYDENVLKHLHSTELMILKDFIKICDDNNLTYYIYGGSLLGAVRHKGFIPWDDDIDVIMFREDYDKFKEIFLSQSNEKYELLNNETYDDFCFLYSKLSLKGTRFDEWCAGQVDYTMGIDIDIFVLDYVSDNSIISFIQTRLCRVLDKLSTISTLKLVDHPFLIQTISNTMHGVLKALRIKPVKFINLCLKLLTYYENTQSVCDICTPNRPQIYDADYYGRGKKIPFEDIEVNAPQNSHAVLEQIYGDYMQLPPEEERYNHMAEYIDFGKY